MKSIFSVLLAFSVLYLVSGLSNESKNSHGPLPLRQLKNNSNSATTTSCGGLLKETSGEISYKLNESYKWNERCIWIIRSENATGYAVAIFNLGFPTPHTEHQLIISGFAHGGNVSEVLPSQTGLYVLNDCNLIVITFHSGDTSQLGFTGFSLQYSSVQSDGITLPSALSRDVIAGDSKTVGHVRHPESEFAYADMELSTFLILQSDRIENPGEMVNVVVALNRLQSNCLDFLDVYLFNIWSSSTVWERSVRICASNLTSTFTHDDAILVVFQSDKSVAYDGFHLMYSRCYMSMF